MQEMSIEAGAPRDGGAALPRNTAYAGPAQMYGRRRRVRSRAAREGARLRVARAREPAHAAERCGGARRARGLTRVARYRRLAMRAAAGTCAVRGRADAARAGRASGWGSAIAVGGSLACPVWMGGLTNRGGRCCRALAAAWACARMRLCGRCRYIGISTLRRFDASTARRRDDKTARRATAAAQRRPAGAAARQACRAAGRSGGTPSRCNALSMISAHAGPAAGPP